MEKNTYGIAWGSHIWAPCLVLVLMDTTDVGLVPDAPPRLAAAGDGGTQQSLPNQELSGEYKLNS